MFLPHHDLTLLPCPFQESSWSCLVTQILKLSEAIINQILLAYSCKAYSCKAYSCFLSYPRWIFIFFAVFLQERICETMIHRKVHAAWCWWSHCFKATRCDRRRRLGGSLCAECDRLLLFFPPDLQKEIHDNQRIIIQYRILPHPKF